MNDMTTYVSPTERVKTWTEGPILHIRFNNPAKHNALSVDMWEAVPVLLAQAERDDNIRMVVLSGEGGKSFISGADISQFEDMRAQKEAVKKYESDGRSLPRGHLRVLQAHDRVHQGLLRGRRRERGDQLRPARRLHRLDLLRPGHAPGPGLPHSAMRTSRTWSVPATPRTSSSPRAGSMRGGAAHRPREPHRRARRASTRCSRSTPTRSRPARRSPSRPASGSSARS